MSYSIVIFLAISILSVELTLKTLTWYFNRITKRADNLTDQLFVEIKRNIDLVTHARSHK